MAGGLAYDPFPHVLFESFSHRCKSIRLVDCIWEEICVECCDCGSHDTLHFGYLFLDSTSGFSANAVFCQEPLSGLFSLVTDPKHSPRMGIDSHGEFGIPIRSLWHPP